MYRGVYRIVANIQKPTTRYHVLMRNAYALIGLGFVIVFAGIYLASGRIATRGAGGGMMQATGPSAMTLSLTSSAFEQGASIPARYTCDDRREVNPPLRIEGAPAGTKSLALIVDDPDIPAQVKQSHGIQVFDHWVLFNIPASTTDIPEGAAPGTQGVNGAGQNAYTGPCPPPQYEPREHRYFFYLYALDTELELPAGATKAQVQAAIQGHVLAEAQLMGRYQRR
jgi:Raf kinase inhibitor-like YbhB/YbcL family protein